MKTETIYLPDNVILVDTEAKVDFRIDYFYDTWHKAIRNSPIWAVQPPSSTGEETRFYYKITEL